jgi:integrase
MVVWDEGETRAFLGHAREDRYFALYLLALATGMRQGEMLALRWRDVRPGRIEVRGSLDQRTRLVGQTKTHGSRRRIDLPAAVVAALESHRERMRSEGLRVGSDDLVFANAKGAPIHASDLYRRSFRPCMEAAAVPIIRFHDLRHTAATLMLGRGVHPKIVQERLGHASIKLTLDTYSHVLPSMQQRAVELTADIFEPLGDAEPVGRLAAVGLQKPA